MNVDLVELLTHPAVILSSIIGLDLLFGDPVYSWHPVRLIGNLISWFETKLRLIGLMENLVELFWCCCYCFVHL